MNVAVHLLPEHGAGTECRGHQGQLSGPALVSSIAWWQILMCGPVFAGMGRLPYSAGPAVPSMQLLSSIDVVLSWNRYLHVDLFAHCRLRRAWEVVIVLSVIPQGTVCTVGVVGGQLLMQFCFALRAGCLYLTR